MPLKIPPLKRPSISLPRIKLPFLGKASKEEEGPPDFDPDDTSYLEPTGFQKRLPWIGVGAAYGVTLLLIGGVAGYLVIAEDEIIAEMADQRPRAEVSGEDIVIRNAAQPTDADAQQEAETGGEQAEPTQVVRATDRAPAPGEDTPAEKEDSFADLLQPHPDPNLIFESPVGPLPVIGNDGRQPWQVYSRPYNALETRPRIALVITDLGTNNTRTEQALALPGEVTLAFAPYARRLDEWIDKARATGHEVLLTLPMEPRDFPRSDPGPFALMSSLDAENNLRRLEWILSRATGYVGLVGYQGSGFSANPRAIRPIMADLKGRGLAFLDPRESAASVAQRTAATAGVPAAQADLILDLELGRASVLKQLKLTESLARANGTAIVIGRPYPVTLDRIRIWLRELAENGFALTPLSGVISERISG